MAQGAAFLLKLSDGDGSFETVAGLRTTSFAIDNQVKEVFGKDTGWREFESGVVSVSIHAAGIFLGSQAETAVRSHALAGTVDEYELSFEDGTRMRGKFLVQRLDYVGDFNGERNYAMQLESAGEVKLV